jgi:hypothetical protein
MAEGDLCSPSAPTQVAQFPSGIFTKESCSALMSAIMERRSNSVSMDGAKNHRGGLNFSGCVMRAQRY